jgi:hypothetical protein
MSTPIYAESSGSKPRELVPAGMHIARCYSMIDMGTQETNYGKKRQIRLIFELPTELRTYNEQKGMQPMVISSMFTLSMHEKASLRIFLENWRGKTFTDDEAKRFDVTALLGKECLLNVKHEVKTDGKIKDEISSANPLTKGMTAPLQINPMTVLSFEDFDFDVYNELPKFIQDKIAASPEYGKIQAELAAKSRTVQPIKPQEDPRPNDIEDDLPF